MKKSFKFFTVLSGAALLASSHLTAESVSTNPVGYVTVSINAASDARVGVPLMRSATFGGSVNSISAGVIEVSSVVPDVTSDVHFLWVTSGALAGQWFTVEAATSSSLTVSEDLESAGLLVADSFSVVPFWTLESLLPSGGGLPQSSNVFDPVGQVLLNDVNAAGVNLAPVASYIYHDGAQGPAGWYDANDLNAGIAGDTIISPETYITVRNSTVSAVSLVFAGSVPVQPLSNGVKSSSSGSQDTQVPNPYPAGVTYANSNLLESGALRASPNVFDPLDQLLLFPESSSGYNPAPTKAVLYHDGSQGPAGWYDANDVSGGTIDSEEIPAGSALVIRRAAGNDEILNWTPSVPYSL
jgi:uncharacterized protein (TIGR02597 family)